MKKIVKYLFSAPVIFTVFLSCRKEESCADCKENNKPPTAIAGPDQVITLPTDSVLLDGRTSSDPDGTISNWLWTKISGPASFNVIRPANSITMVKNLSSGIYQFELKVSDNEGLSSRDTIQISVTDAGQPINRAPVANAGQDQTIILTTNTTFLNGGGSSDPDNNIISYLWTRISGPSFPTIVNANEVQTQVQHLVEGVYEFELKVTDAGGLFDKDSIVVAVLPSSSVECNIGTRAMVDAQLIPFGSLSKSRTQIATAAVGTKILFAGGNGGDDCSGTYAGCWGSSRVDIYDFVSGQWSIAELSQGRWGIASVTAGNKIFFAGGETGDGAFDGLYATVDIYDATTNTWSATSLSEPRSYIAAATVGTKVFFAGGGSVDYDWHPPTKKIDVYDMNTGGWSTSTLSEPKVWASGVAVGQKVYFAGGFSSPAVPASDRIDIYDNQSNNWSTSTLFQPMSSHAVIASGNKIYWSSGCDVEIKDVNSWNSSMANLSRPGYWGIDEGQNAVIKDNKIIFYKPNSTIEEDRKRFDIYDITTGIWSIGVLNQPVPTYASIICVNNTIYIAGGFVNGVYSKQVWKLEF